MSSTDTIPSKLICCPCHWRERLKRFCCFPLGVIWKRNIFISLAKEKTLFWCPRKKTGIRIYFLAIGVNITHQGNLHLAREGSAICTQCFPLFPFEPRKDTFPVLQLFPLSNRISRQKGSRIKEEGTLSSLRPSFADWYTDNT